MSAFASVSSVKALVKDMESSYLQCRDYGHAWKPVTAYREGSVFIRVLGCANCETQKKQRLSRRGEILSSSMVYPKGYLFHGVGRIAGEAKDVVRLASLQLELEV